MKVALLCQALELPPPAVHSKKYSTPPMSVAVVAVIVIDVGPVAVGTLAQVSGSGVGGVVSGLTVRIVSSAMAVVVLRALPAASFKSAPAMTWSWSVPTPFAVTGTLKIPGAVSVTVPMATVASPALLKSAAETVASSMSSLKVTV